MGDGGRMMNFVSEKQLDELKEARGARPEDGTVSVDKPLWEILKANKEAKDNEWAEKHRHKTQKTLDEDEVYFLDAVDLHQREQEKLQKQVEAQELAAFQVALLEKQLGTIAPLASKQKEKKDIEPSKAVKRTADKQPNSLASMIRITPQPKKQKVEREHTGLYKSEESEGVEKSVSKSSEAPVAHNLIEERIEQTGGLLGLQTYGSDDDEDDHPDK